MDYFRPDKYYYVVPLLDFNFNIKIKDDEPLREYVKTNFPALVQLQYRLGINKNDEKIDKEEYEQQLEIALDYLNLPKYILVVESENSFYEPATGTKVSDKIALLRYRVSDLELNTYFVAHYERKINNFYNPNHLTLMEVSKNEEDFIETLNKYEYEKGIRRNISNTRVLYKCKKKGGK